MINSKNILKIWNGEKLRNGTLAELSFNMRYWAANTYVVNGEIRCAKGYKTAPFKSHDYANALGPITKSFEAYIFNDIKIPIYSMSSAASFDIHSVVLNSNIEHLDICGILNYDEGSVLFANRTETFYAVKVSEDGITSFINSYACTEDWQKLVYNHYVGIIQQIPKIHSSSEAVKTIKNTIDGGNIPIMTENSITTICSFWRRHHGNWILNRPHERKVYSSPFRGAKYSTL